MSFPPVDFPKTVLAPIPLKISSPFPFNKCTIEEKEESRPNSVSSEISEDLFNLRRDSQNPLEKDDSFKSRSVELEKMMESLNFDIELELQLEGEWEQQ
jgi:hypothetical protein